MSYPAYPPHDPIDAATAGDVIFADGFESGDLSAWSSSVTDGGDLSAAAEAALVGSYGLKATADNNPGIYVVDETPAAEARYRAHFHFDPNSTPMASGNTFPILWGLDGSGTDILRIEFRYSSGAYQARARLTNDADAWAQTSWFTLSDAPHTLEVDWRAATSAGANDGGLTLWIDGTQQGDLSGVDNDTLRIESARLGLVNGAPTERRGTLQRSS